MMLPFTLLNSSVPDHSARPSRASIEPFTLLAEAQLDVLGMPGEVGDDEEALVVEVADEDQHLRVLGIEELDGAPAQHGVALAQGDHALGPPEEGMRVVVLGLHVERLVVVLGVDDHREVELLGVGA